MKRYNKNLNILKQNHIYSESMEHDACGVGLIASTEGKKTRRVVEYGIQALKAVWHRGAIDADGKTGDGAGIHIEIPTSFFKEKIENYGRQYDGGEICVGMIFLPRNDYNSQEKCKTLIETELLNNNFYTNLNINNPHFSLTFTISSPIFTIHMVEHLSTEFCSAPSTLLQ